MTETEALKELFHLLNKARLGYQAGRLDLHGTRELLQQAKLNARRQFGADDPNVKAAESRYQVAERSISVNRNRIMALMDLMSALEVKLQLQEASEEARKHERYAYFIANAETLDQICAKLCNGQVEGSFTDQEWLLAIEALKGFQREAVERARKL